MYYVSARQHCDDSSICVEGHIFENVLKKCVIGVNVSKVTNAADISLNRVKNVYLLDFKFGLFKVCSCTDLLHIGYLWFYILFELEGRKVIFTHSPSQVN